MRYESLIPTLTIASLACLVTVVAYTSLAAPPPGSDLSGSAPPSQFPPPVPPGPPDYEFGACCLGSTRISVENPEGIIFGITLEQCVAEGGLFVAGQWTVGNPLPCAFSYD